MLGVMMVEANDQVVSFIIDDVKGGFAISHDPGTWIESLYLSGLAIGMTQGAWWSETVTQRGWIIFALSLACLTTLAIPSAPGVEALYGLRFVQGLAEGFTLPLLMEVALAVLGPHIRLYGLCIYSMTVTFTPTVAVSWAALWGDLLDWQGQMYAALPLSLIPILLVLYGMPKGKPEYERLHEYDWGGLLLGAPGIFALTTMMYHGRRLDWFNSELICILALVAAVCLPLFVLNELRHPCPLMDMRLFRRRNFTFPILSLFCFVIYTTSSHTVPVDYLAETQYYRPIQAQAVTVVIALSQPVLLPLSAWILNRRCVDARIVMGTGVAMSIEACVLASYVTVIWNKEQFYLAQALQAVGQALTIMSLLMIVTNALRVEEGPGASAIVNTTRALAETASVWLIDLVEQWRGTLHYDRIVDQVGRGRFATFQAQTLKPHDPPPLLPDGLERFPGSLKLFATEMERQALALTTADVFLVLAGVAAVVIVCLAVLPERTYPPRYVVTD
ncbi:MFS transporter [Methylobacterium oryzae]|uniref:MFS transporter n=1 Tax=Methylobacterium oryzae TaxID=334852 RepID=UPI002F356C08